MFCLAAGLASCSSAGTGGGDGSAVGGSGGGDAADPCSAPLSQNTVCDPTFAGQVADNPCDQATSTQAICGRYKVWKSIVIGSDSCVYDTSNNGMLVGARSCGGNADCPQGCITFGIPASQYATCGAETPACPP